MPPRQFPVSKIQGDDKPRRRRLVAALLSVPGLMPALAHAQLVGDAAYPQPLDGPGSLRLAPQLEERPLQGGQQPSTFLLSDKATGTSDEDMAAKGAAEIRRTVTVIKGDALHYDQDTDMADAFGNVRLINNGVSFIGPEAHLKVEANEGFMTNPKYHFNLTGGSGSAERIDMIDNERTRVDHGTYTACQCESDPAWYIKGTSFDFDTGADDGIAHNGVLFFQGVPVFASPWLSFPLTSGRRSGLLPPTFSVSSTTGVELTVPYYFNIAPNRDLTITPRIMTRRGVLMEGNYRYLSPTYSGSLDVNYLPNDRETHTNRYAIFWQHRQNFGGGFGGYVNYNKVSDDQYPEDLGNASNQFLNGTQLLYQQEAGLTYNNGPWSVLAREQRWQTLQPSTPPYAREPQVNVQYNKYNVGGFDYGFEADATRFTITTEGATDGNRLYFNPYLSYGINAPGYFVTPKVQWHFASYDLSHIATSQVAGSSPPVTGQPKNFTESIPTISFDTGLVFDRSVRLFGQDYIQTLEPRLYYVYTPYHNQDFAPIFDTAEADFGLAEIYTPNTFVGNDRIADANRLTAGLTTRFINPATGDERARFVIAQQYYFQSQRVTITPGQEPGQAKHSDLIAGAAIKLGAGFASETAFQYNVDNNQLVRSSIGFAFSPGERRVVNVGYRYTRSNQTTLANEPINQILLSGEWPLTNRLYAVGRVNYDLASHRLVDGLVGFQYDADCWAFGFGMQRYANGVNTSGQPASGTRVLAQLTFKGLSNVDNGLVSAFRASVQGYQPPPPAAPPLSRYSDYE
ncbi:LPS-assembly protein LptD [Caballeronia cordobensis]|uniref:LPS-assembly protein LptD n=1 Tax=Caballeronia cordobensis TaxID=1353886 RepID=UPI00045EF732|nr:LPS-assembly protein LptD precursor [Burkholderia sp. RPE67]